MSKDICIWCGKDRKEGSGQPCSAPDGGGHLFKPPYQATGTSKHPGPQINEGINWLEWGEDDY